MQAWKTDVKTNMMMMMEILTIVDFIQMQNFIFINKCLSGLSVSSLFFHMYVFQMIITTLP